MEFTKMKKLFNLLLVIALVVLFCKESVSQTVKQHEINSIKNFIDRVKSVTPEKPTNHGLITKESVEGETSNFTLNKITGAKDRKSYLMNGNRISTYVFNYGAIGPGYGVLRGKGNVVWRGQDYIFQFCPFVGASVPDNNNSSKRLHIISDALWDYPTRNLREVNPTGDTLWTFQPLLGYDDPTQTYMASNPAPDLNGDGKPDSWPTTWYNPILGRYVWPGYLEQDATNADVEVFWAMDDRDNREFNYFPFAGDMIRRGLGLQIDGRGLQWSNTLAENSIFFVYSISNVSQKNLDSIYFGIYGDPDLGGGCDRNCGENSDDDGLFIPPYNYPGYPGDVTKIPVYARSLAYYWDPDMKGYLNGALGYLGCKYLESPGNANDGLDNDGDGVVDESQVDGIDNDADWNPLTDDVGIDGIPNTNDQGEGDALPTAGKLLSSGAKDPLFPGEPNFEYTDLDESDQIGLSSFNSWAWANDRVSDDESMWNRIQNGNFGEVAHISDIVFIFASGPIKLKIGETKRISMSLLLGESLDDLLITAATVQRIYNANYKFFKPPTKPNVYAIGGDKKVTLYWDTKSEESKDPLTGKDFEGYVIYRSTDPDFSDIQKVTDGKGNAFFSQPLKDLLGNECKWDVDFREEPFTDVNGNGKYDNGEPYSDKNGDGSWSAKAVDWWKGYHPVPFSGRGIQYYLGNNSGLVHSFVDSNNVINGLTYYYAVVSYDHGDSVGIPPTETTKKISIDPITSQIILDVNTVQVTPGPRALGYTPPDISVFPLNHVSGIGNGKITLEIINDLTVLDNIDYKIMFKDTLKQSSGNIVSKNYSVLKIATLVENVQFVDTNFSKLTFSNIDESFQIVLKDENGKIFIQNQDFIVDYSKGLVRRTGNSQLSVNKQYSISYRNFPVYQSTLLKNEDANPVFDGIRIKIKDNPILEIDTINSRWISGKTNCLFKITLGTALPKKDKFPANYEVKFSSQFIDSAKTLNKQSKLITIPVKYSVRDVTNPANPLRIPTFLKENLSTQDSLWGLAEEINFFKPWASITSNDTVIWALTVTAPLDSTKPTIIPSDGDILQIITLRPYNSSDVYTFKSQAGKFNNDLAKTRLDKIYVVPNPYVGYNQIEPTNKLPGTTRGERRIYFENLPPKCTIRIYTLSGDWVQTLNHETSNENGREYWNLLNSDGFSIAYGIYFAHIDAPGIGEKLVKFAIVK
jgi:hypothetical protein